VPIFIARHELEGLAELVGKDLKLAITGSTKCKAKDALD